MDAAWQGKEHMAKFSVNAMIGLWARSTEVVYSVRSSSSELDGTDYLASVQKLDWLVVEEITQLDMALWADLACVGLNADVKSCCWETSGSCRPCWTPGPGGPSERRWSTASSSATWPAGTGTSSRRTCAPTPVSSTS